MPRLKNVTILLFGSGACALIYQVVWLREFRLVFGASTYASAAVLAIFMGGLGLGGAFWGKRADRHPNPLLLYGYLEILVAIAASITPLLIDIVRLFYVACGGVLTLGLPMATSARLGLSVFVLGLPTFLMGGTLPAAVRAVEVDTDQSRRHMALLYGSNTCGAVFGTAAATFFMLEIFGLKNSLWLGALVNLLVGLSARSLARRAPNLSKDRFESTDRSWAPIPPSDSNAKVMIPAGFVYAAAGTVGFVFFLMEMVWYRMLAPLLGGSTYTFGLILTVALLGIGIGGCIYYLRRSTDQPSITTFALTCGLEGLFMAIPFALGDRIAVLTALLNPLDALGFEGRILSWSLITVLVVLPAAVVAGFQFPLLIGLLGMGKNSVGRHVGMAYASNTIGAIMGALAGGFGLMPLLSALGTWQAAVCLLLLLGIISAGLGAVGKTLVWYHLLPAGVILSAGLLLLAQGPTAAWRHQPIGVGLVDLTDSTPNQIKDWINHVQRSIVWQKDGRESSVALHGEDGYAFMVNGKTDGNARYDAATQVMLGLVPAILHPNPQKALVIGLGTGSTAGWLAEDKRLQQVDVVEIESCMKEVARYCSPVNRNILFNPKVRIIICDGREMVLTSPERYDLIVSEPSNPYRAGIASLYTKEFYQAVRTRLKSGGLFAQWVQGYEIDAQTLRTIYATLASVFPVIETWQTQSRDLLLLCSLSKVDYPVDDLRRRIHQEPFRSALLKSWGVIDLEGFLCRFVAGSDLACVIAQQEAPMDQLNLDDRMRVEYGFARQVGMPHYFSIDDIRRVASALKIYRPPVYGGNVDWELVKENFLLMLAAENLEIPMFEGMSKSDHIRIQAYNHFRSGNFEAFRQASQIQSPVVRYPLEIAMMAEAAADSGDEKALRLIDTLKVYWPLEADIILAQYRHVQGDDTEAAWLLVRSYEALRRNPWFQPRIVERSLKLAEIIAKPNRTVAKQLYDALSVPFSVNIMNHQRKTALLQVARWIDPQHGALAVMQFEPHIPWNESFLKYRSFCYQAAGVEGADSAAQDLRVFWRSEPVFFHHTFEGLFN